MSLPPLASQYLQQNLIPIFPGCISLRKFSYNQTKQLVDAISQIQPQVLGVSLQLSEDATIDAVAFATQDRVFLLNLSGGRTLSSAALQAVFSSESCLLASFDMARLALHVYRVLGCHSRGVDLGTLLSTSTRDVWSPSTFIYKKVYPDSNRHAINAVWFGSQEKDVCLRAWLCASLSEMVSGAIHSANKIDTAQGLRQEELTVICRLMKTVELLEQQRPKQMQNEFEDITSGDGSVTVKNAAYKSRVRRSEQTTIVFSNSDGTTSYGQAIKAEGKATTVKLMGGRLRGAVESIRVIGRDELTNAERARDEFLLRLLRGEISLADSELIQLLWFPTPVVLSRLGAKQRLSSSVFSHLGLNPSQEQVANAMILGAGPLVIAHGPPGTGKTKTISAAAQYWDEERCPVWVVAQSNVGVKNIALSFAKLKIDFKLIVSKEFFVEWHEHLYSLLSDYIVRSDDLFRDAVDAERLLNGSVVILSTLSMLSNPAIKDCRLFDLVPVERLVVDEASQINAFEFMHLFAEFKGLQKMCLFGDPKQLPPYGKEAAPEMQTIFDFKHLRAHAYFLNTQYRMPLPLGNFISCHVYDSKLQSNHKVEESSCIKFVDVANGEEERDGQSWINTEEIHTVVNLVRYYYHQKEFCIITPYDAQRRAIQKRLKTENLPWDMVYNVDSFQGHEEEFVIVSTVRTTKPGFLNSQNRMNVMLTRCQLGMVIVTNRQFLFTSGGQHTLLGLMANHWEGSLGRARAWTSPPAISDHAINLPGVLGKVTASLPPPVSIPAMASSPTSVPSLTANLQRLTLDSTAPSWRRESTPAADPFPSLPEIDCFQGHHPWRGNALQYTNSGTSYSAAASQSAWNVKGKANSPKEGNSSANDLASLKGVKWRSSRARVKELS